MKQIRFQNFPDTGGGGGGARVRMKLGLLLVTLLIATISNAQNVTQAWPTTLFANDGNMVLNLGDATGLTGLELNVWMLPTRANDNDQSALIFKFLNLIEVNYDLVTDGTLKHGLSLKYSGKVSSGTLALTTPYKWMNLNLRVQFGSYITLSVWQGTYNVETTPELVLTHPNPTAFSSMTVDIQAMTPDLFMQLAEMRIFELDMARSFGQYFKYYHGLFPTNLANDFTQARQYYTSYNNVLYLDIRDPTKNMSNPNAIAFPIERCVFGQMIGPKAGGAGLPVQTLMTLQQCNYCSNPDCSICPMNYQGMCKYCKKGSATCVDDLLADECPNDYFLQQGICIRCPPGCTGCTSSTKCTECDIGLVMFQSQTHKICKCTDGKYGLPDYVNDKLNCYACDTTTAKCMSCEGSATKCTACNKALNLYLYEDQCVTNCKTQMIPSYTSDADQKCLPCGENCLDCTSATQCNADQCKWEDGVVESYFHNGVCKVTCPDNTINSTVTKTCSDCGSKCAKCHLDVKNCMICELGYVLERKNALESECLTKCPAGKYPDASNVCQVCPNECSLCEALNQCTQCKKYTEFNPAKYYYFVNFQCLPNCPDRYYKDSKDPNDLFCRSCPSGCNQCNDESLCTLCDLGWYLDTFQQEALVTTTTDGFGVVTTTTTSRSSTLCVNKCQPGYFPRNATDKWRCMACLENCERCDNETHCAKCSQGYALEFDTSASPPSTKCVVACKDNFFANAENECRPCISGCKTCSNNHTCDICESTKFLISDTRKCVSSSCPSGYFRKTGQYECYRCLPTCLTCSFDSTCDSCIIGYQMTAGGLCETKCGNGQRDDDEECDDNDSKSPVSGDGCSDQCRVEPGFVCMPLDTTAGGVDVCFCDAKPLSAAWTAFWGTIEIRFASTIMYNPALPQKSADAKIFCTQILDPKMMENGNMGTDYSCFLEASATMSSIRINVDLDATIGNKDQNYMTTVKLLDDVLRVAGCPKSIPLTYTVTNLPLDTPTAYFQSSLNGDLVPKCASYYGLNIFTSKGFTKRNVQVSWQIQQMIEDDSELFTELDEYLREKYSDVKYFEFNQEQIEKLAGKQLKFRVVVTNFLGLNRPNLTSIDFSSQKQLMLVDLQDIYTFQTAEENTLAPRVRIPYCSGEDSKQQENELKFVQIQCWLFSADLAKRTIMPNCTIPAFNMTVGSPYKVRVNAVNMRDPNMGVTKWVHIDTQSPNARVAYIEGCDRLFSVNSSFELEVMVPTNVSYAKFNWFCTDLSTGSPCFTTSFSYITMANTKKVVINGGQLFSNNTYKFKVIVFDTMSQTQDTKECLMYAALLEDRVLDIAINTEANRNGFIDFNAQMAAFKVQLIGGTTINSNNLNFTWKLTDSSGTVFQQNQLSIYQNSMGVLISKLERSNVYQVETNVTLGQSKGYIKTTYETEPQMPFEFSVEPPEGEPHKTVFTFSVTSQDTLDGLYSYVFGYFNPIDKSQQIPIYQRSTNRYQRTMLPVPEKQNYLTCYVQVMLPSGESKTYQQNVTLTMATITVAGFKQQLNSAVMDDLVESMQIKNKLITLRSKMTLADRTFAIRQILKGLENENTPLSDYNIQSSVASLLEYISNEVESLMSDSQIVTVAAKLFQQITIGENKDINRGRYTRFGRSATFSLYNFANNLFQKDFSNVIGGAQQLEMKVMFMQGLKNILKGCLSNQILGDLGGFSYQGQNIYVKAVKFDQLENFYRVNASLPKSLDGKLSQNFVNITLPGSQSDSNPCKGKEACQVSVIILDTPTSAFLSNQKDSRLMSIYVDVSIQETEVSSPYSYVEIKDLTVKNLKDPIQLTIPLLIEFTDTSKNRTLGCGYLDENDQIFKSDGLKAVMINTKLVTCQALHLTAIGVEEYAVERQAVADDSSLLVASNSTTGELSVQKSMQVIDLWGSWAVYTALGLFGGLLLGCAWGYRRDKRDELNLRKVFLNKERIYINLYLDPIPEDQLAALENDDDDYEAIQQERARQQEIKKQRQEAILRKNQNAAKYVDENAPVPGLFSPEELQERYGMTPSPDGGMEPNNLDQLQDPNIQDLLKTTTKKKKKKKKTKISAAAAEMLFEGGSQDGDSFYEGGSGDEDEQLKDEDDAQTVKTKAKKKKKKAKRGETFKAKDTTVDQRLDESAFNPDTQGEANPLQPAEDLVIDDFDGKSVKSKKSKRSVSKKKTLKKKATTVGETSPTKAEDQFVTSPTKIEDQVVINKVNLASFKNARNKAPEPEPSDIPVEAAFEAEPAADNTTGEAVAGDGQSRRSKKSAGKKKRGARSSSARRQRSVDPNSEGDEAQAADDLRPDFEAEEVTKKSRFGQSPNGINKKDLFKPIKQLERERLEASSAGDQSPVRFAAEMDIAEDGAKSNKSKKKGKKKKIKKKKTKQLDEQSSSEEEKEEEQRQERDGDEEIAGCCQFCFWNFREGHRCLSFFSFYNEFMSRPTRWALLIMSWYLFMCFTGLFMGGQPIIADKSTRPEQFVTGAITAMFCRVWVLVTTYFLMQPKAAKILEQIPSKIKANREIRNNNLKFLGGLLIITVTCIFCGAQAFSLSNTLTTGVVQDWGWAFLFAIIADFIVIDALFMSVVTIITMKVGAAPDACGRKREMWLKLVPPAIKESIE